MGRAEKRLQERKNRINSRKDKIIISREELGRWKEHISQDTSNFNVEALMTCFALSLSQLYQFDSDKMLDVMYKIDNLMGAVMNGEVTIDDYKRQLEEAGVVIKCKD